MLHILAGAAQKYAQYFFLYFVIPIFLCNIIFLIFPITLGGRELVCQNDNIITWGEGSLGTPKSDYVICARPLRAKILIFPAKVCQGVSQFLRCSTPSKVVSLLFCNIVIIRISPNTSTAPKFHNISGYCFRVTGLLCLGILYPCRTSNSR